MAIEGERRQWSRREVLAFSVAGTSALMAGDARGGALLQPSNRPWGVQLYTVRDQVEQDAAKVLRSVAAIGYKELEILQPTLPKVAPIARKLGLSMVSAHLDEAASEGGEGLPAFIAQARDHGLRYLVIAWVPPERRPTDRAGFERLAERFSRIGDQVARAGMQLCYHNHAFEFGRSSDGARWLDVLMKATEAANIRLELDVFWVSVTGAQPLDVINQYGGRIALMHLKDRSPRATPTLL